jgi:hypothetical protein
VRPDQTDPGQSARASRGDGWTPESSSSLPADDGDAGLEDRDDGDGIPPGGNVAAGPWPEIKSRFVDDPLAAIAAAEEQVRIAVDDNVRALKAEAAEVCAHEHDEDAASTEALRTRLIRYQAYCEHLARTSAH